MGSITLHPSPVSSSVARSSVSVLWKSRGLSSLTNFVERVARAVLHKFPGCEVDDLVQSVFVSVLERPVGNGFRDASHLRAYLAGIARNKARDVLRKAIHRKRIQSSFMDTDDSGHVLVAEPIDSAPSPVDSVAIAEIQSRLKARLTPREVAVFEKRCDGTTNLVEIARDLGVHPQTAREDLKSIQKHVRRPSRRRWDIEPRGSTWSSAFDLRSSADRSSRRHGRGGSTQARRRRTGISKSPPSSLLHPGDRLGPYRILGELGRGTLARVYLAEAQTDRALVALKVSERLSGEAAILQKLDHPHIVDVVQHSIDARRSVQYLAMPYIEGAGLDRILEQIQRGERRLESGSAFFEIVEAETNDLAERFAIRDRVSSPCEADANARANFAGATYEQVVIRIVERLALALDHARLQGFAHGDLKPSNVWICRAGNPILLDFNLAVFTRARSNRRRSCGGTIPYMAPEALRRFISGTRSPIDAHRADLYSLGIILLELLTGKPPAIPRNEGGPRAIAAELAEMREEPLHSPRLESENAGALISILQKALAPDPAKRYSQARLMAADLHELLDQPLRESGAEEASVATSNDPPLRRRRRGALKR